MPAALEPAARPAPLNINAQSPAEVYSEQVREQGGKPTAAVEPGGEGLSQSFTEGLTAAQRGSRIQKTDVERPTEGSQAESPASQSETAKPRVPGLPAPTPEPEWKPRGETAKHFDILKQNHAKAIGEWEAKYKAIEAQLEALKTAGNPEQQELKKRYEETRAILKDVAIERDPEFKSLYETRSKAAIDAAKMAAGEKGEKLEKLLNHPNSPWREEQIDKLIEDLTPGTKRRVEAALTHLEQIDIERSSEIARRRATFDEKQSALMTQQKERDAARQQALNSSFGDVRKEWTDPATGHPFFVNKEGDEEHNKAVNDSIALANAIYNGELNPKELAAAAFWAASGERVLKGWQAAMKEAQELREALDKVRGVQPGEGRAGSASGEEAKAPNYEPGSADSIRSFNRGLKEAQMRDSQRRFAK